MNDATLTIFSWGYYGWGSTTQQLVESFDAVEKLRGYGAPFFVDARIRRSVRAVGFRDAAFERLLGAERYRWMRGLGNKNLDGGEMELANREDVEELLDLAIALAASSQRRRVIFFCSCQFRYDNGRQACHRCLITDELIARAERRGERLTVVEWPGTPLPETPEVWALSPNVVKSVARGRKTFVAGGQALEIIAGLAWATPLWITADVQRVGVLVGPARYESNQWVVPVLRTYEPGETTGGMLMDNAREWRRTFGFEPEGTR